MGKLEHIFDTRIVEPVPDRHCNRVQVERSNNGELHIHYRNLKIALLDYEEQKEWVEGFREALDKFKEGNFFQDDV